MFVHLCNADGAVGAKNLQNAISFECFVLVELFDDTAMFLFGQMLSAMDTLDTHECFMMALMFLSMLSLRDVPS